MVMVSQRMTESLVGLFLLGAVISLLVLAFKVSGLTSFFKPDSYTITAAFDDIGQLKVRSPVKIGGVLVGEVADIKLDPSSFKAVVYLLINRKFNDIPNDSSASILTAGLLGDNYIAISPMYSATFFTNGGQIQDTHSAMVLEKLIGQLLFKIGNTGKSNKTDTSSSHSTAGASP
jgi:phospholipid/cholesterol/gamma-HCH transport system substrate-binding protein